MSKKLVVLLSMLSFCGVAYSSPGDLLVEMESSVERRDIVSLKEIDAENKPVLQEDHILNLMVEVVNHDKFKAVDLEIFLYLFEKIKATQKWALNPVSVVESIFCLVLERTNGYRVLPFVLESLKAQDAAKVMKKQLKKTKIKMLSDDAIAFLLENNYADPENFAPKAKK